MTENLRCTVVTPTESIFDEGAVYANVPAWDGQLGVMPQTSPFLTRLGVGVLTVEQQGARRVFAVGGGFAQMQNGVLTVLADAALAAESIDAAKAEAELSDATARLREGTPNQRQREVLERAQKLAFTKVALARR